MTTGAPELRTERLLLRRWGDEDRDLFAALNADPEVMAHFPAPLDRAASDAFVDRADALLGERGWGLWAVEAPTGFIGFTGLAVPRFEAAFTPCVEIGWRLARSAWGQGFATEAARAVVAFAWRDLGLTELVSFTTVANARSRAVMERLGMSRDPAADFDHPLLAPGEPTRPHVLYRLQRPATIDKQTAAP